MDWLAQIEKARKETPVEKQKEFLALMHKGKTLREAYETVGISFDAANGIMRANIVTNSFSTLNHEPVS
jgi:hypothetical protein